MQEIEKLRNIGIAAHIDSGKTTLSERVLYYTGKIHQVIETGSKSGAGPTMDSMDLEREKGITIQSAATFCQWKDWNINLIDTPGHIDFTVEVERALRVLDGAVLVLCGVAGVQSQTLTVDRQMRRYNVPRIVFINKVDRSGANPDKIITQLNEKLSLRPALITMPIGLEDKFQGLVDLLKMQAVYYDGEMGEQIHYASIPDYLFEEAKTRREQLVEVISDYDDGIAEKFLAEEEVSENELLPVIRRLTISQLITPVFVGTAKKNKGIQNLLDGICNFLPNPLDITNKALDMDNEESSIELMPETNKPAVALAFKLEEGQFGQLTYIRIYQGMVKKGDYLYNMNNKKRIKVPRLVRMHASQMNDIPQAGPGDIVAMFGVECSSGDTFTDGNVNYTMTSMFVPNPVLELSIAPKEKSKQVNFSKAINRFIKEDPTFRIKYDEESRETIISGMGELHLEIYVERIRREYDCEVIVGRPKVAYRETITRRVEFNYTHKKQTGGAGQYARIAGYIDRLEDETSEYEFSNRIVGGVIPKEYIPACDKGFQEQLHDGFLIDQPIVGVKVEINDGQTHPVDSSEKAFHTAAKAAIRETMKKAAPIILEPIMKLETTTPEEFQGSVIGLINQRRGMILNTKMEYGYVTIEAEAPLKDLFGYATDLRSNTQGKAEFTMEFLKYTPVPKSVQEDIIKDYNEKKRANN